MQNDNDEFETNDGTAYSSDSDYSNDSQNGNRRGYYREPEPRGMYAQRQNSGDSDVSRVLLRAVNDVLNQYFPLKTLFADVEFDCFKDQVIKSIPEFAVDRAAFMNRYKSTDGEGSSAADLDEYIDEVLRALFFHAGGTLVGTLKSYQDRNKNVARYLAKHRSSIALRLKRRPKMRDDFFLDILVEDFKDSIESDSNFESSDADDLEESYRSRYEDTENNSGSSVSASRAQSMPEPEEEVADDVPWASSYKKACDIVDRYFDGAELDSDSFVSFRRLFFLKSSEENGKRADFASATSLESLIEDVNDAVAESITSYDSFDVKRLVDVYESLNNRILLEKKSSAEMDEITQLAIDSIGESISPDDEEELTERSDFNVEYELITKYVLKSRFSNRHFNRDFSDFEDFYEEFLRVAGPRARASEEDVREYFEKAGGLFLEEPTSEAEEVETPALTRGEAIKKVLSDNYPEGLDLSSHDELIKFCEQCGSYGTYDFDGPDAKLRSVICRCAVVCDDRAYSASEKDRKDLKENVEAFMRVADRIVYYDAFFQKKEPWLVSIGVPNPRVLRALLASCFPKYTFYDHYFEATLKVELESQKVRREILRFWGAPTAVRTPEELAERTYISEERIKRLLAFDSNDFAPCDGGFTLVSDSNSPSVLLGDKELDEKFRSGYTYENDSRYPSDGVSGKILQTTLNDDVKSRLAEDVNVSVEKTKVDSVKPAPSDVADDAVSRGADRIEIREPKESVSEKTLSEKSVGGERAATPDWRKYANQLAKILSNHFKGGLGTNELASFREKAAEKKLSIKEKDDSELLQTLMRVGFVCDDRIYVVSQKTKAFIMKELVDPWFDQGGKVVYYESLFARHEEKLLESGVATVHVLENRLRKYYPDYAFSDEYFEAYKDDDKTLEEKIVDDVCVVWDGGSSKRLNELAEMVYVPREKLEEALKEDEVNFDVRSNGYWTRKDNSGKKRVFSKRKSVKK